MNFPARTKTIVIRENKYEVKFPNNGQFIDIQALKAKITSDTLSALSLGDTDSQFGSLLAAAIATFNILMPPAFKEDLKVKSLLELELPEGAELVDIYVNQYLPWYNEWMNALTKLKLNSKENTTENKDNLTDGK